MKFRQSLLAVFLLLASSASARPPADQQRSVDWIFQPKHHKVELQWKRRIESNLLWMIDRAEHPSQRQPDAPLIGVYADAGVWPLGAHSVVASLEVSGFAVEVLDWNRLHRSDLTRYHAVVFPGGYSYFQQISAGHRGLDAVRDYVEQGGRFMGICAGAFLAAKDVQWEGKQYPYPLVLFDGVAEGSIKELAAWPGRGSAKLAVTDAGKSLGISAIENKEIYYQGGCRFTGGSKITSLATYFDGTSAIIQRPFGRNGNGIVVLTGVHFERPAPSPSRKIDESEPPPLLSHKIFPKLLGITPSAGKFKTPRFSPEKYVSTVTATTTEGEWQAIQRELRLRLSELRAAEIYDNQPIPTLLAKRGKLILDDKGTRLRGGKTIAKFAGDAKLRAGAGSWHQIASSNIWRSTWKQGHAPVAAYHGFKANNLVIEVTFRYGPITESWQHQCFRIAADDRPEVTGHIVSAWANPNNDFIETGFLLQHIRKTPEKKIIEDLLLDHQPLAIEPEVWYTATLEIVDDQALFRLGDHVAYAKAEQIRMPKNLISLTLGTTWHDIKRVRIWEAKANATWQSKKASTLKSRTPFTPVFHSYNAENNLH